MYKYKENCIEINGKQREFKYNIGKVEQYKNMYMVLVEVPYDKNDINNIYCLDEQANIVWQSEDLNKLYPTLLNLPYEYMDIVDDIMYTCDFMGRHQLINMETGKIEGRTLSK